MNNKKAYLFLIGAETLAVVLLGAALFMTLRSAPQAGPAEPAGRQISMEKISETAFEDAFAKMERSLVEGAEDPQCPTGADYYQVRLRDEGYSPQLPIDGTVYFAVEKDGGVIPHSCFVLLTMPESPRYLAAYGVPQDGSDGDVFLKVEIGPVVSYDKAGELKGQEEFRYTLTGFFNTQTLEIDQLNVR